VTNGIIFDNTYEYLTIVTDKGTIKRIKLFEIEKGTRARKGISILKEIKSNPHRVLKTFIIGTKDLLGIKEDNNIKVIKKCEVPIMDI
jgi:topoisomerase-4 subunit A